MGPLSKPTGRHEFILIIINYATCYTEAVPLQKVTSKTVTRELVLLFPRVGLPKNLLTDQGMPFMSQLMKDACWLLQVKQTSKYHHQTDGLVECFNQTLKRLLL